MRNELVGFLSTIAAMVIFLSLNYFYKERFKKNLLEGKQRMIGVMIVVVSIITAFIYMYKSSGA
ncbi:MAG: hypothetical protein AAF419_02740 [Pseudomonadota bacterium]